MIKLNKDDINEEKNLELKEKLEEKLYNDPIIKQALKEADIDNVTEIEQNIWKVVDNYLEGWSLEHSSDDLIKRMWKVITKEV